MLRRAALVRTDISEERNVSMKRMTTIGELGITLAVTANLSTIVFHHSGIQLLVSTNVVSISPILVTLMMEAIRSSETSVLTRATPHNILE
jgi:hypothetical protein